LGQLAGGRGIMLDRSNRRSGSYRVFRYWATVKIYLGCVSRLLGDPGVAHRHQGLHSEE
jgi:hypothetical protein